ncbi:unnamed protein product [Bathycoccus prasinos]
MAALVLFKYIFHEEFSISRRRQVYRSSLYTSLTDRSTKYTKSGRRTDLLSILQKADPLPQHIYNGLNRNFPATEVFQQINEIRKKQHKQTFGKDNFRYDIVEEEIRKFLREPYLSLLKYHSSCKFYYEVLDLFRIGIKRFRPDFYESLSKNVCSEEWYPQDGQNKSVENNFALSMRVGMNTPSKVVSSNKGPHIDRMSEIFGSLLYIKNARDETIGGEFHIHSCKHSCARAITLLKKSSKIESPLLKIVQTVKYEANTLVFFINSPLSVHSVGLRHPGEFNRQFLSIYGDVVNTSNKYVIDKNCCSNCVDGGIGCKYHQN